jgi:Ca2+-binding EF-hand superfamily protein
MLAMSNASPRKPQPFPSAAAITVEEVLDSITVWVTSRRSRVREFFLDFDRLRSGRCSKSQFARGLNLIGMRLSAAEADVLACHFAEESAQERTKADFKVNYERFCEIVENLTELRARRQEPEPYPRSDFVASASTAEWSHTMLSPVKKVQAKTLEKRVRLLEYFQDFDALRKGMCTQGQVKTVFTILGLDKEIEQADFKALQDCYSRADGMFCYAEFCNDMDLAVSQTSETDPLMQLSSLESTPTSPLSARRNRQFLSEEKKQKVYDLEEKIRARVKFRRCLLRPAFQDLDRTRRGHVTRSQFARVMCMNGFELTNVDVDNLCGVYCDMGNLTEFNYLDFCMSCDPINSYEKGEAMSGTAMENLPKYFDAFGQVTPRQFPRIANCTPRSPLVAAP